jgi:phage terminase large subunit-like protein
MARRRIVVRGNTYENALNLGAGYIDGIEREYGGTRQGDEELFARMFDDADGSTCKAEHIKRRPRPSFFLRRVLGIDVATTSRTGSDTTGMVIDGLAVDGKVVCLGDFSGKMSPEEWGAKALDIYVAEECDCVVVETNKGGDLVTNNLRAAALVKRLETGEIWQVNKLGKDEKPAHQPRVINVREVYARGEKADRAKPLSTAYEKGLIVHVDGIDFEDLEEILTTWIPEPGARSPDRLDAHVHAVVELLGLKNDKPDHHAGFRGIEQVQTALASPAPVAVSIAQFLKGSGGTI